MFFTQKVNLFTKVSILALKADENYLIIKGAVMIYQEVAQELSKPIKIQSSLPNFEKNYRLAREGMIDQNGLNTLQTEESVHDAKVVGSLASLDVPSESEGKNYVPTLRTIARRNYSKQQQSYGVQEANKVNLGKLMIWKRKTPGELFGDLEPETIDRMVTVAETDLCVVKFSTSDHKKAYDTIKKESVKISNLLESIVQGMCSKEEIAILANYFEFSHYHNGEKIYGEGDPAR
jgi:hypothetical protein